MNDIIREISERGFFTLQELGLGDFIKIPAVQRSLVWKPSQVELLWDSILRGFPIGAFIISKDNDGFDLLDGQQRYNAISLGFNCAFNDSSKLWIDLAPTILETSTRKFMVKVTTAAHPWGYKNDDGCETLKAYEKRDAMERFGLKGKTLFQTKLSVKDTWPVKAHLPVPLHILIRHSDELDEDSFLDCCLNSLNGECDLYKDSFLEQVRLNEERLKELYHIFRSRLSSFRVPFCPLSDSVIENESESESEGQNRSAISNIEVLFRRITAGGTQITQSELNYSAIKVYWPEIKDICDTLSQESLPSHLLANIAFRLYKISASENGSWANGNLTISEIRKLSSDKEKYNEINIFFRNLGGVVRNLNHLLLDSGIPPFLKSAITRETPDIYILLLWLSEGKFKGRYLSALAFFLKWFTSDPQRVCSMIYDQCKEEGITETQILSAIYSSNYNNLGVIYPYSPKSIEEWMLSQNFSQNWRQWHLSSNQYYTLWSFIIKSPWGRWGSPDLLIYAERNYINHNFANYDPAKSDLWETYNRPWDYDHILPYDWIHNRKGGEWREFCKQWLNCVGNLAAIPFEVNRAKGAQDNWSHYLENSDELYFDSESFVEKSSFDSYNIIKNKEMAIKFAKVTIARTIKIYSQAYNLVKPIFDGVEQVPLSSLLSTKKEKVLSLCKLLNENDIYPILRYSNSGEGYEYEITNDFHWSSRWIGIELDVDSDFSIAVSCNNAEKAKVGLRLPSSQYEKNQEKAIEVLQQICALKRDYEICEGGGRWFAFKEFTYPNINPIITEIQFLLSALPHSHRLRILPKVTGNDNGRDESQNN